MAKKEFFFFCRNKATVLLRANDIPGSVSETKLPFVWSRFWKFGVSAAFAGGGRVRTIPTSREPGSALAFGTPATRDFGGGPRVEGAGMGKLEGTKKALDFTYRPVGQSPRLVHRLIDSLGHRSASLSGD